MNQIIQRLKKSVIDSLPRSYKTCVWLLKIMLPISLGVRILDYYGFIEYLSTYLHPLFNLIGLPGSLAIIFVTSIFVPLYGSIAVMASLSMTLREATIISIMCLIAHNLFVECAVTKKTGSSFSWMMTLRISMAFVVAYVLNKVLPVNDAPFLLSQHVEEYLSLTDVFSSWFYSSIQLTIILVTIVTALMILQRILIEFNWIERISKPLVPLMRIFGLSDNAPFLWIVGNVVGLAYGGAVMVEMIEDGKVTKKEADMVNHHMAISHSLLEDTVLFVALGINIWVIIITRVSFAIIVVWSKRLFDILRKGKLNKS
ncbi:nucleoside recognition domain protein [Bacteroides coprosuis DSM 18011]|uniref:Nucleoside recognition domain protein n=1 Tax=Bacteroides coprosuis DSM 18011 TaxID=679937 RepID=F3ZTD4_9BACE|nr:MULTISPECIES: nucleoside recognition protein [Bacteroides]EGJ71024.1 nucleoside recognition domain protein [Bacteroides coprosuis DSM 18011]HJD91552.1 nucleoside recognition protein [Bacteroides coprosuis]